MKFTKMHGCGNDYIYVDCTREPLADPNGVALRLSDRHFGIGVGRSDFDLSLRQGGLPHGMYNSDGSEGAMCGNGIRCVAKFCYDKGLTDQTAISVETGDHRVKYLDLTVENGAVTKVKVDMGVPAVRAEEIPVTGLGPEVIGVPVQVGGKEWTMTCVSMGNPHAVVWCDDVDGLKIEDIGPQFESHPMFPDRVNTEFAKVLDRENIQMPGLGTGGPERPWPAAPEPVLPPTPPSATACVTGR